MKLFAGAGLKDVQAVYSGAEGALWELVMGEQVHIGGLKSSMVLAEKAGIGKGMHGVDFCCCTGAGMRFLVRFRGVELMQGVDATGVVVERGLRRCREEGLEGKIRFILSDVCRSGLSSGGADFVWGEDAWCYVEDKALLVSEAARIVKPGGLIAFTDWVEGPVPLTMQEAERYLRFMKFPSILGVEEYCDLLVRNGCSVVLAEDTGQFAAHVDLYLDMLNRQLTYDALKLLNFDMEVMQAMAGELGFIQGLAHAGKISQCRLVARKEMG